MEINTKIRFVEGAFETKTGELICVSSHQDRRVDICFRSNMHVPFAQIRLFSMDRFADASDTFEDAKKMGEEICRRWNECENPL